MLLVTRAEGFSHGLKTQRRETSVQHRLPTTVRIPWTEHSRAVQFFYVNCISIKKLNTLKKKEEEANMACEWKPRWQVYEVHHTSLPIVLNYEIFHNTEKKREVIWALHSSLSWWQGWGSRGTYPLALDPVLGAENHVRLQISKWWFQNYHRTAFLGHAVHLGPRPLLWDREQGRDTEKHIHTSWALLHADTWAKTLTVTCSILPTTCPVGAITSLVSRGGNWGSERQNPLLKLLHPTPNSTCQGSARQSHGHGQVNCILF